VRNYGSKHVRNRLIVPRQTAVCPFPGKHMLRLVWKIASNSVEGMDAFYFGKFTTSAWKRFVALAQEVSSRDVFATTKFHLFDRAGELTSGSPFDARPMSAIHKLRYFPEEGARVREFLLTVTPRACGRYWVYSTDPLDAQDISLAVRNIETAIPTLRNR
jgi:hypothetical protein